MPYRIHNGDQRTCCGAFMRRSSGSHCTVLSVTAVGIDSSHLRRWQHMRKTVTVLAALAIVSASASPESTRSPGPSEPVPAWHRSPAALAGIQNASYRNVPIGRPR